VGVLFFSNLRIYRDDIRPLLEDGEEPLAAERITSAYGSDRVRRTTEERLNRALRGAPRAVREGAVSRLRRAEEKDGKDHRVLGFFLSLIFLDFSIKWPSVDWKRVFGGVTVAGDRGSHADRLSTPTDGAQFLLCVITDRRLLLVKHNVKPAAAIFDLPRQAIFGARRKTRGLSRSRVVLEFDDASSIVLHAGFINMGGPADRIARAVTGVGRPAPD
jgi:hypothetical protein